MIQIFYEAKCPKCNSIELQRFETNMKGMPAKLNCGNCGNDVVDIKILSQQRKSSTRSVKKMNHASVCSEYAREDGGTWLL